jgi:hypothetical protein
VGGLICSIQVDDARFSDKRFIGAEREHDSVSSRAHTKGESAGGIRTAAQPLATLEVHYLNGSAIDWRTSFRAAYGSGDGARMSCRQAGVYLASAASTPGNDACQNPQQQPGNS